MRSPSPNTRRSTAFGRRAQRHAHANLLRPLRYRLRHRAIDPYARQQQRGQREPAPAAA